MPLVSVGVTVINIAIYRLRRNAAVEKHEDTHPNVETLEDADTVFAVTKFPKPRVPLRCFGFVCP